MLDTGGGTNNYAIDGNITRSRRIEQPGDLQQRRFSRSARSHQRHDFAFSHVEIKLVEHGEFALALFVDACDVFEGKNGIAHILYLLQRDSKSNLPSLVILYPIILFIK